MSGWQLDEWVRDATETDAAEMIRAQQYIDFARGRPFRMSLLRHESVAVLPAPSASLFSSLYVTGRATRGQPSAEEAALGGDVEAFQSRDGMTITTNNPAVIAMLRALICASPCALSFAELADRVSTRLEADRAVDAGGPSSTQLATILCDALKGASLSGLVDVDSQPSRFVAEVSPRPRASALARHHVCVAGRTTIPTLQHGRMRLRPVECRGPVAPRRNPDPRRPARHAPSVARRRRRLVRRFFTE